MNKEGLKALLSIANKQNWNGKPVVEVITTMLFSEDMGMNLSDIDALLYITSLEEFQYVEYEKEEEYEEYEEYDLAMVEELAWYNHARMMGWE